MPSPFRSDTPVLAIGASTGGPTAVAELLAALPDTLSAAVLVVQHLDLSFSKNLADMLGSQASLPVSLAESGDRLKPGKVFVAKGGDHMVLSSVNTLEYRREPADNPYRPSIDALFESLAKAGLPPGVAVLLTGMGNDGAHGLLTLKKAGWFTIAQDQSTSAVYGMPKAARELGAADLILPLSAIASQAAKHLPRHD
ncbi:MAG: chemotaxis protein CheB [Desulfovibrio sp.]|nr:chemotaxis protein CheB [Desulfovibrio sp.]MBI4959722.1 chemotaxis protein CheB [Desulfovibrio sp.]